MSSVLATSPSARDQAFRVLNGDSLQLLHGVTWDDYRRFRDRPENDGLRMAYADGVLLLMTIGRLHERIMKLIGLLATVWFEECSIPSLCCGSMTYQSELHEKGLEPDNCWYFSHIDEMQRHDEFDPDRHLPIDLALEVDITTNSEIKLPIYAALRVREVWLCGPDGVRVLSLKRGKYVEQEGSRVLAAFPLEKVVELVQQRHACDDTALVKQFRGCVRNAVSNNNAVLRGSEA
jgi:Uma2 family endonuclease